MHRRGFFGALLGLVGLTAATQAAKPKPRYMLKGGHWTTYKIVRGNGYGVYSGTREEIERIKAKFVARYKGDAGPIAVWVIPSGSPHAD